MPAIGPRHEQRIEHHAKLAHDFGQWVRKIAILAPAKSMALHDHAASKAFLEIIELCDLAAFIGAQQARCAPNPALIELASQRGPVEGGDPSLDQLACSLCSSACLRCTPHRYPDN